MTEYQIVNWIRQEYRNRDDWSEFCTIFKFDERVLKGWKYLESVKFVEENNLYNLTAYRRFATEPPVKAKQNLQDWEFFTPEVFPLLKKFESLSKEERQNVTIQFGLLSNYFAGFEDDDYIGNREEFSDEDLWMLQGIIDGTLNSDEAECAKKVAEDFKTGTVLTNTIVDNLKMMYRMRLANL